MPHAESSSSAVEGVPEYRDALIDIVQAARDFRQTHSIERVLCRADFPESFECFQNAKPAAVEAAARDVFYNILATTQFDRPEFVDVWNLLDICQIFSDDGTSDYSLAFYLVEELLESLLLQQCRAVFDYLELRREIMTAKFMKSKNLIMLRACNELLRRLSRAEDTAFSGRVFIYLFQIIDYGDTSAVNLRGEFHTENVTAYDETVGAAEAMDLDDAEQPQVENRDSAEEARSGPVAEPASLDKLYPVFWSIQKYFSQPPLLFDPAHFSTFKAALETTLAKFKEVSRDSVSNVMQSSGDEHVISARSNAHAEDELIDAFNPKYLTSPDLFELEISDLAFRRHILVQGLILMDFLLYQTPKSKRKLPNVNKGLQFNHTLSDEDAAWATEMRASIASYLQQGNEGKFYYRLVDTVLSRDKNWVYWKCLRCPRIGKLPVPVDQYIAARDGANAASASKRLRPTPMSSLDLGFLHEKNAAEALAKLRDSDRYTIPQSDTYRQGISNDELDLEMPADEEEKATLIEAKTSKTWRTLRLASRRQFRAFDKIDETGNIDALFRSEEPQEPQGGLDDSVPDKEDERETSREEASEPAGEPSQAADALDGAVESKEAEMVDGV